ncbi:MAG: HlyD family efflux transporter periplasmic adaptor subunit [Deltaproteobacteria bacterium]|nr:HlyD family efflux transporter periplasmic adaptor subunit [Deltaproteobacteria bacterium]
MIKLIIRDPEFLKYKSGKKSALFPRLMRRGGLRVTLLCFLFLFFSLFLPWTQTIRGTGRVIAYSPNDRVQSIDSPVYGRLGKWFVEEGSFVRKGDPIVQILDNDPELLQRLEQQKEAMRKSQEAIRESAENSKKNFLRLKQLLEKGIVSQRDFEKSKIEYNKLIAQEAKANAELLKVETTLARQAAQDVKAPRDGFIQRRRIGSGSQLVKTGDSLALLVPNTTSRSVEIFLSDQDIPFVHTGHKVRIQFAGWPAIQSFGWPSLARGTFGGKVAFIDKHLDAKGFSRVLVVPDPEEEAWPQPDVLRQGNRAYAWVLLNRVSLGFELWRNFNGFPQIISQDDFYKKFQDSGEKVSPEKNKSETILDSFTEEDSFEIPIEESDAKNKKK